MRTCLSTRRLSFSCEEMASDIGCSTCCSVLQCVAVRCSVLQCEEMAADIGCSTYVCANQNTLVTDSEGLRAYMHKDTHIHIYTHTHT